MFDKYDKITHSNVKTFWLDVKNNRRTMSKQKQATKRHVCQTN